MGGHGPTLAKYVSKVLMLELVVLKSEDGTFKNMARNYDNVGAMVRRGHVKGRERGIRISKYPRIRSESQSSFSRRGRPVCWTKCIFSHAW